jgi:hypothetical protein
VSEFICRRFPSRRTELLTFEFLGRHELLADALEWRLALAPIGKVMSDKS